MGTDWLNDTSWYKGEGIGGAKEKEPALTFTGTVTAGKNLTFTPSWRGMQEVPSSAGLYKVSFDLSSFQGDWFAYHDELGRWHLASQDKNYAGRQELFEGALSDWIFTAWFSEPVHA